MSKDNETEFMPLTVVGYWPDTGEAYADHVEAASVHDAILESPDGVQVLSVFFGHHEDLTARCEVDNGSGDGKKECYVVAYQSACRRVDGKAFNNGNMIAYSPMLRDADLAECWVHLQPGVVITCVSKRCVWSTEVHNSL